jgi:hypothetical protein
MLNLAIFWLILAGVLFFIVLYAWYLTWPVSVGVVTHVDEWTRRGNGVIGPRKCRHVRYEYEWGAQTFKSSRQSLFLAHALSPKKQVGDNIAVSVCSKLPAMTCPRRPGFELMILLVWVTFLSGGAMAAMLGAT